MGFNPNVGMGVLYNYPLSTLQFLYLHNGNNSSCLAHSPGTQNECHNRKVFQMENTIK